MFNLKGLDLQICMHHGWTFVQRQLTIHVVTMKLFIVVLFCLILAKADNESSSNCNNVSSQLAQICDQTRLADGLRQVCDLILYGNVTTTENSASIDDHDRRPTPSEVWGYSLLSVTVISLMSVLGVSFLPLMSKTFYSHLITSLIGLAVGSLSGRVTESPKRTFRPENAEVWQFKAIFWLKS